MTSDVDRLVAALDEEPDSLHGDRTPAVVALVERGLEALPPLLPLLESAGDATRLRAQRVLEGVTRGWVAERVPSRPLARADARAWAALWEAMGGYRWDAPPEERAAAVARWRAWLEAPELPRG